MPDKVIIDTDPGVDDILAILLALSSPELDVQALTITFGNTLLPSAYLNTLKLFSCLAREFKVNPDSLKRYGWNVGQGEHEGKEKKERKIVLVKGAEGPIAGDRDLAAYFHGSDGLSNISQTHPHFTPPPLVPSQGGVTPHDHLEIEESKSASEIILDILKREERGSVRIIALGPLSNVALALQSDPETFSRVKEVVWMGGALDVPGNTSPVAEFNCFADPYAVQELVNAVSTGAFKFTMCPLDITTPHTISFSHLIHEANTTTSQLPTPLREFTSAMLIRVRGLMKGFGLPDAMEMHDPMAVWYVLATAGRATGDWPEGWEGVERVFGVERTGEMTRGMCVVDRRGTGEQSFLRTKSEISSGANADQDPSSSTDASTAGGPKGAPMVVTKTPGSKALEDLLLARMFGGV